jgi:hypothetical protein
VSGVRCSCTQAHTEDILTVERNSSLSVMEKLFICWPIWTSSPWTGAKMSFVIARMLAQLLMSSSVASGVACTMICGVALAFHHCGYHLALPSCEG